MPCPVKTVLIALIAVCVLIFQLDYNGWASGLQEAKEKTYTRKFLYYFGLAFLVFFHVELFTGGLLCRLLFAKNTQVLLVMATAVL